MLPSFYWLMVLFVPLVIGVGSGFTMDNEDRSLPERFSVEVFPAVRNQYQEQDAVVYHFDGERVSGSWQRTDFIPKPDSKGTVKWVTTTRMEGTFRGGVLQGEQQSESVYLRDPGDYGPDFPGGAVMRHFYRGEIEGRLQPDGRIKGRVTTTLTRQLGLNYGAATEGEGTRYWWAEQPLNKHIAPATLDYWVPLPSDAWFNSRYILASGAETFRLRQALERLDRYLTEAGDNLLAGRYPLAQRQSETIRAEIDNLRQYVGSGDRASRISFRGLPTDDAMIRRIRLQFMMEKWKEAYTIVNEALGQVQKELANLRGILSANVFKSIIKNYISWSGSIPTDIESGIAGYSPITSIAELPRGFLGWYEAGQKDAGILQDQFRKKRALEELEVFYEKKRHYIVDQRKEVAVLLKALDQSPLAGLDGSLHGFFSSLDWAPWLPGAQRSEAMRQLRGSQNP
ncbi:MAG: hypothetical protein GX751_08715 [Desulfuromonadaceae bacterium]|nr:hypothetical protein [Desulfuromonadaceae bacterium]